MRTSNPQDEFFVVAFNDRPNVVVDYTSNVDDVDARMVMLKPQNRTALIDAVYLGLNKLKDAKYERKALLIISDGGDNRSRYTEGELRKAVREGDVQIYSIGIFDQTAATEEEKNGPALLTDICEQTGGRLFRVTDVSELGDIAARISAELRNEYVVGYKPTDLRHDGNWRKLKVKLNPRRPAAALGSQSSGLLCTFGLTGLLSRFAWHCSWLLPSTLSVTCTTGHARAVPSLTVDRDPCPFTLILKMHPPDTSAGATAVTPASRQPGAALWQHLHPAYRRWRSPPERPACIDNNGRMVQTLPRRSLPGV